jgi:hypothetical protein
MKTIERFGKYPGTGGFSDSPGSAKKIGMRCLTGSDGIFQRTGYRWLSDYCFKVSRTILSSGYDILAHPWLFPQIYLIPAIIRVLLKNIGRLI